jgi:hypothetical protein
VQNKQINMLFIRSGTPQITPAALLTQSSDSPEETKILQLVVNHRPRVVPSLIN